jgi:glucokinase
MADLTANLTEKSVGIEVSMTTITGVCLEPNGQIFKARKTVLDNSRTTLEQIVEFINDFKNDLGGFDKIGIAVPGLVHQETKRIAFSTHIPEHSEVDLLSELEAATKLEITIENDANAGAYGEFRLGAGRGSRNMFYATLGTGVGGALILEGKIWRGASGFAGEFGYMTLNSEGMRLEEVASTGNIVRRTRSRFHQDSTTSLGRFVEENITIRDIVREAKEGDDFASLMLERTGIYVGTAIAGVINLLNIEKVVVNGEIMQAENLVLDAIINRSRDLSFKPSFDAVKITEGELGENAAAIGAALIAGEAD